MHKAVNGSSLLIMSEIFKLRDEGRCNLRLQNTLKIPLLNVFNIGADTVSLLGHKIWRLI